VGDLDVRRGQRVLELGCGTGQVTAKLLAAGADVVAIDVLPAMLARARTRAPDAAFVEGDIMEVELGTDYDCVVLSFVLHNFDVDGRLRLLRRAAAALAPGGRLGVLDWSLPSGLIRSVLWRRFLSVLEPEGDTTQQLLSGALDADIPAAGLSIVRRHRVAGGRAQVFVASLS
jgi:ubiquinone/menaquinone biosynthesis C-methylase UbiE